LTGPLGHLGCDLGKTCALGRGEKIHFQPFRFQANFGQELLGAFDPAFGAEITFQVMTSALQSTGDKDGVGSFFECPQQVKNVYLAGTG